MRSPCPLRALACTRAAIVCVKCTRAALAAIKCTRPTLPYNICTRAALACAKCTCTTHYEHASFITNLLRHMYECACLTVNLHVSCTVYYTTYLLEYIYVSFSYLGIRMQGVGDSQVLTAVSQLAEDGVGKARMGSAWGLACGARDLKRSI